MNLGADRSPPPWPARLGVPCGVIRVGLPRFTCATLASLFSCGELGEIRAARLLKLLKSLVYN
jgi:hypothetical protein